MATSLALAAAAILLVRLIGIGADPEWQYGIDFQYWYAAAVEARAGLSPYPARYLESPVPVTDFGYRYPPTFAQALIPLSQLSLAGATHLWAAIQLVCGFLAVWVASALGGARRSAEHLLWSIVAVLLFTPFFDSIHKGNVSAVQSLQVALMLAGGSVAGLSLATAVLLKSTPLAVVPAALVRGGRLAVAAVVSGLLIAGISLLAAPQAWTDFVRIQPNLFGGDYVVSYNLQPASLAAIAWPDAPLFADALRAATLLVAAAALLVSILVARRPAGWPAAVCLAIVAMLMVPGAIWYHYLAMLLPLAAFAWPRASTEQRLALLTGAGGIAFGLFWLPLITGSAGLLVGSTLWILWPRPVESAEGRLDVAGASATYIP